ncbi:flagellar biogenesis chaperone FlgN [Geotalea uraniireducens]|uniref:Flagellar biogenesis chaperone FlgN n=1 Tax=Geotalea uraniireducens TaxID=351604 RepID=A0ABN6VVN0_9BACT|nr:flagellar protein FlgN [Geotalea uraniireducens]BDV44438.1 flagellar biogenesis chaperone FlgN [Geotalea uraniireducens]
MREETTKLMEILNAREASMKELLRLLGEERQNIVSCDMERLQVTTDSKVQLAEQMETLDRACRKLLAGEGEKLSLRGTVSLSPLIAQSAEPAASELKDLQQRLSSLSLEVRRLLDENKRLLDSSLSTVGRSLTFFRSRLTVAETYGGSGHMVERPMNSSFLRKEI